MLSNLYAVSPLDLQMLDMLRYQPVNLNALDSLSMMDLQNLAVHVDETGAYGKKGHAEGAIDKNGGSWGKIGKHIEGA